jgi:hypothetical protein
MKKYLVIADYVRSKNDGDRHYIGCNKLMNLYGVHAEECICLDSGDRSAPSIGWYHKRYPGIVELRPSYIGDYTLGI